jgi:hypothetical protein
MHLGVGSASGEGADSITTVEDVDGSPFDDTITGSTADDVSSVRLGTTG